ncbi:MAG TPA: methylaspartate mutase subunit E [Blastocatellia bacterium]
MRGYSVIYLGVQNPLEDFFRKADAANVIMVSCMDGHAGYYLQGFPELKRKYGLREQLWYLGGNLDIGDGDGYEKRFLEMGFHRVFVKYVDIGKVLNVLNEDLSAVPPSFMKSKLADKVRGWDIGVQSDLEEGRLELREEDPERRRVLEQWKTGLGAVSLRENAAFLKQQPSFARAQSLANGHDRPILIQPRCGVALIDEQIRLFRALGHRGAHVLSYQVDSLTRNNDYAAVERAIKDSKRWDHSTLNGFPVVNHGVDGLRKIVRCVDAPLQTRHSTRDARLLAEISYAGGVTSFEGGPICYNLPYYKDYPLTQSLKSWKYIDRLTGLYNEKFGIVLDREFFGTLTATLIPPCLAISINVIEAILAVQQGVKCVSLGYAEQGNRSQDIAAVFTMDALARQYLANLGYRNIQVNTVFHQYMAAFPSDRTRACELIFNSAITAALSRATRVIVKTPVEASRIPLLEDNANAIELAKRGIAAAPSVAINTDQVDRESMLIQREVECILDSVLSAGGGNVVRGVVASFQKGFLDIPFAPSIYNRGEVVTARDVDGAVRFASPGNLQLDRETRQLHQDKMADRRRAEGLSSEKQNYLLVEQDLQRIARSQHTRWPLSA